MIAVRNMSLLALASGALFIGFFGGGPIDFRSSTHWGIRCDLQPDTTLAVEIEECYDILEEQVYEGEALGEVYFRLGYFHHRLGDWQTALENYAVARELRPKRASAHLNAAGLMGRHLGDWEAVVDATTDVIALIPPVKSDHSDAWIMRAIALLMLQRGDEAVADIKVAQKIDPDRTELVFLLDNLKEVERLIAENNLGDGGISNGPELKDTILILMRFFTLL